jgi:hypothetical protein
LRNEDSFDFAFNEPLNLYGVERFFIVRNNLNPLLAFQDAIRPHPHKETRHVEAVAPVCLNTPYAINLLRSLETSDARRVQAAPDFAGLRPRLSGFAAKIKNRTGFAGSSW